MKSLLRIFTIVLTLSLTSCNKPTPSEEQPIPETDTYNQWVYITIETVLTRDTTTYFYYGKINDQVMKRLNKGNETGHFTLKDIRYLDNDDLLELYEDEFTTGDLIFRVQDIARIQLLKKDPIYFYDIKELSANALRLSKQKRKPVKKE
ncbi:hypothetical protein [Flavobacterium orientale]|uniref:Lipoprotein n=1 Tax=Flavobacterium orientale TaxID=1756020 RepID=A0A917DCM5_9FLAO|nr:hypothetical protein [Flavobacterium orientale]GGD27006.1 hypothetical protein GCM10011343_16580 [Flavobacterium orientale]